MGYRIAGQVSPKQNLTGVATESQPLLPGATGYPHAAYVEGGNGPEQARNVTGAVGSSIFLETENSIGEPGYGFTAGYAAAYCQRPLYWSYS